jgi:hypothetical protein
MTKTAISKYDPAVENSGTWRILSLVLDYVQQNCFVLTPTLNSTDLLITAPTFTNIAEGQVLSRFRGVEFSGRLNVLLICRDAKSIGEVTHRLVEEGH